MEWREKLNTSSFDRYSVCVYMVFVSIVSYKKKVRIQNSSIHLCSLLDHKNTCIIRAIIGKTKYETVFKIIFGWPRGLLSPRFQREFGGMGSGVQWISGE